MARKNKKSIESQLTSLRRWYRFLQVCVALVLLGFGLMIIQPALARQSEALGFAAYAFTLCIWALGAIVTWIVDSKRCPRCGKFFFADDSDAGGVAFRTYCGSCNLSFLEKEQP